MENHFEKFCFRALLSKLVDPRHHRGQPIRKMLKKRVIIENNFNIKIKSQLPKTMFNSKKKLERFFTKIALRH
jgi:hypothetical protein